MGAPKGSSRLLQRIGRANHRLDEPSRALIVPGNRFDYLEARAALDAVEAGERDADRFCPGGLDVLAEHVMALACADRKSTRLNSSHYCASRMPTSACINISIKI